MQAGQHDSCIPGMVTGRRIILLVGSIVLFIDNHQSEVMERKEKSGPSSEDNLETPGFKVFLLVQAVVPDFNPFVIVIFRMINPHIVAEVAL